MTQEEEKYMTVLQSSEILDAMALEITAKVKADYSTTERPPPEPPTVPVESTGHEPPAHHILHQSTSDSDAHHGSNNTGFERARGIRNAIEQYVTHGEHELALENAPMNTTSDADDDLASNANADVPMDSKDGTVHIPAHRKVAMIGAALGARIQKIEVDMAVAHTATQATDTSDTDIGSKPTAPQDTSSGGDMYTTCIAQHRGNDMRRWCHPQHQ